MKKKSASLNQIKLELAENELQYAQLQQKLELLSESYQSRSWWLIVNIFSLIIGIVIVASGFFLARTTFDEYFAIALNTILGAGVTGINASRIMTYSKSRKQQSIYVQQLKEIQSLIRIQEEIISGRS